MLTVSQAIRKMFVPKQAQDDDWITTERGSHVLLGEGGEIKAGMGGKFNGKKMGEVVKTIKVDNEGKAKNPEHEKAWAKATTPKTVESIMGEKPKRPDILDQSDWNGKVYGGERSGYSIYQNNKKIPITAEQAKALNLYTVRVDAHKQMQREVDAYRKSGYPESKILEMIPGIRHDALASSMSSQYENIRLNSRILDRAKKDLESAKSSKSRFVGRKSSIEGREKTIEILEHEYKVMKKDAPRGEALSRWRDGTPAQKEAAEALFNGKSLVEAKRIAGEAATDSAIRDSSYYYKVAQGLRSYFRKHPRAGR